MHRASDQYKEMMTRKIYQHSYMTVSLSIVNNEAQASSKFSDDYDYAYWSNLTRPFTNKKIEGEYATFEQNFYKADGSMSILPEDNEFAQFMFVGTVSENLFGSIGIVFDQAYDIKGLTIDFGDAYPTSFRVETAEHTYEYSNTKGFFETEDLMGETTFIIVTPLTMVGGQQRMRINNTLMGIGLNYTNDDISSATLEETVSGVSENIPSYNFNLTILDPYNTYNVDNDDSFANFLHTMQDVVVSMGMELDDGSTEWIQMEKLYLSDWKVQRGKMGFTAKDKFAFMEDTYSKGNFIGEKNLYEQAEQILQDAGYERDEYVLDEYLRDVNVTNPIPSQKSKECLQLIANAARCKLYQDYDGRICIVANFVNVLEPDDVVVSTEMKTETRMNFRRFPIRLRGTNSEIMYSEIYYSQPENVLYDTYYSYATFEEDYFKADGSQYIVPEPGGDLLATSYTSNFISDNNGNFSDIPIISLILPAAYTYYTLAMSFYGNPPIEMKVTTYKDDIVQNTITFTDLKNENVLEGDFLNFDKIQFEFIKTYPQNRINIKKIAFGNLSDYTLTRDNMLDEPIGFREETIRDVFVRVFSYQDDESGTPQQVQDDVWVSKQINTTGNPAKFENPLIGEQDHANLVCEWLAENMLNNISYDISYRGEPRINAADIIFMEGNDGKRNQCEVEKHKISFSTGMSGTISLRKMKPIARRV